MPTSIPTLIDIYISYSNKDEKFEEELEMHLHLLQKRSPISIWSDRNLIAGDEWRAQIDKHLNTSEIILILVSPNYMESEFASQIEMRHALERHQRGEARVIPIILARSSWLESPLNNLQALPRYGKAVDDWENRDEAFNDIIKGIEAVIDELELIKGSFDRQSSSTSKADNESSASGGNQLVSSDQQSQEASGSVTAPSQDGLLVVDQSLQTSSTPGTAQSSPTNSGSGAEVNKVAEALITEGQLERDAVQQKATSDMPIQNISEDKLGFDVYVNALRDFIASPETSTPLTIGIYATWGSGKSSLMRMVQNELDPSLNFWSRLWVKKLWLKWFFSLPATLIPWAFVKLLIWIDDRIGNMKQFRQVRVGHLNEPDNAYRFGGPKKFQEIRTNLSYDSNNVKSRMRVWLQTVRKELLYDPTILDTDEAINAQNIPDAQGSVGASQIDPAKRRKKLSLWQRAAIVHSPLLPLAHPTIWFNAWKFDQEEQLWAALALETLNQIKQRYNFFQRIIFWFRLTFKRFSLAALWRIIQTVALPLLLGVIYWIYTSYMKQLPNIPPLHIFQVQIAPGQLLLGAGIAVSTLIQILKIAKDPFQLQVKNVFDKPNYEDKIGFLGSFQDDFARIVSLATEARFGWQPRKLVIFIDDLDRCEAPKAADIIEGINLFLDSQRCVFVLGMDPVAVSASIENKYQGLFDKMRKENMALVSPGRLFLDKIIQVPFYVPVATKMGIDSLIENIMRPGRFPSFRTGTRVGTTVEQGPAQQSSGVSQAIEDGKVETRIVNGSMPLEKQSIPVTYDHASYKLKNVQEAISEGAKLLPENPRQIKKYMNLFRFYVYIADARGLIRFKEEGADKHQIGLTLNRLAVWVAWSVCWSEIAKLLSEEIQTSEVRNYLLLISKKVKKDGHWCLVAEAYPEGEEVMHPAQVFEHRDYRDPVYERLVEKIVKIRQIEQNALSHWSYLPWEWWLLDPDFRKGVKEMESFWMPPQQKDEDDWLMTVLTWTRVTLSTAVL